MTNNQQFTSRLSELVNLEKSNNYSTVIDALNDHFDSDVNNILEKWTSYQTLTNDEKNYLKSYSNIHLSIVKYCLFHSNTLPEIQTLINQLSERLFQRTQIETLGTTIDFIRNQQSNSTRRINENDPIFLDLMKLIDARSLTYRLIKDIGRTNTALDDALNDCLLHSHSTSYLQTVRKNEKSDPNMPITYQHQFFLGCCTFGVALFDGNKEKLKDKPEYDKHVCLLVKYVRIMLKRTDFVDNPSIHYCLRGIFALLTNSIPHQYWLDIMNKGLADNANENAQEKNPFNLDLFSLIINKLLASKTFQKKTESSILNDETLLIDSTMVFLVNWTDTERNLDDNEEITERPSSINQLLHYIQSDESFKNTNQILIPYIDAKYDRPRLMTLSILSILMNYEDFEKLQSTKPRMSKDLVELIFSFLDQAAKHDQIYKGISLDTLLRYLYRFLVQDFIKRETLPYLSRIIDYARSLHKYALKILRRLTMDLKFQKELGENQDLKQFLDHDADLRYTKNSTMYPIIIEIRQNLKPLPPAPQQPSESTQRQVFISYSRKEKKTRDIVRRRLTETKLFTKIWIDDDDMRGNAFDATAKAINQSKVIVVLLSDNYCNSDFCQREWKYAVLEKVQVYVIIVQKDFNKQKYDWVKFLTVDQIYFKLDKEEEMQKFIKDLEEYVQGKNLEKVQVTIISSTFSKTESKVPVGNRGYSQKSSIHQWTTEDVQDWCVDNHLERWRRPLKYFDGETLVKLRQDLSIDWRTQLINAEYDLDLFEITRFKTEIDKAIFPPTIKRKPPTRKFHRKHPINKT